MFRRPGLLLLLLFCIQYSTAQIRFSWAEKNDLEWKDFTGFPDKESLYAASVNTGIVCSFQIDPLGNPVTGSIKITAFFYPKLSWYRPEMVSDQLLTHERLHFAITELHAREFRKRVAQFKFTSNIREEISVIYEEIENSRQKMQYAYDAQTQHGIIPARESLWEVKLNQLLAKY